MAPDIMHNKYLQHFCPSGCVICFFIFMFNVQAVSVVLLNVGLSLNLGWNHLLVQDVRHTELGEPVCSLFD